MTKRTSNVMKPPTRANKMSPATSARKPDPVNRPGGKLGLILDRLANKTGATLDELVDATGWQKHSVHGAPHAQLADAVTPARKTQWPSSSR